MSSYDPSLIPRLRPIEITPIDNNGESQFILHDPAGFAPSALAVSGPVLHVLALFDGQHSLDEVREAFSREFGEGLPEATLVEIVEALRQNRMLAGAEFEDYYGSLVAEYQASPMRTMESVEDLGLDHEPASVIADVIAAAPMDGVTGRVIGLIAPHLDYARGRLCYSAAYSTLVNRAAPKRVVILGTNHFGRSTSVVATGKPFATPLGVTACDLDFIAALEARYGSLREHELDHRREHSVELQVVICQHLWGAETFRIVPLLCPDPCATNGTSSSDGLGVDLREFAAALQACLADDPEDTLIIAGADLSHVGSQFGDDCALDEAFLAHVAERDRVALQCLTENDAAGFLRQVATNENPTRICSAGCVFTLMSTLPRGRVQLLRYHQAVDDAAQVGVTCAAAVIVE